MKLIKPKSMQYSEDMIANLLHQWKILGYTDTIIVDHGLLFSVNQSLYYTLSAMREDDRVNIYDEGFSGSAWSMHALTLNDSNKGILILGGEMYTPWELTAEIRSAFKMPPFSSDNMRMAS
jgi:hypothetical protein